MKVRYEVDMAHREERVRERAYYLWEDAGRPHGAPDEFWHRAQAALAAEDVARPAQPARIKRQPAKAPEAAAKQRRGAKRS
ncbi:MAG: DUF2934 domain-containing protein [Acetobacteraceae bacterium]|nr:DUF2934 domain-containing protein [Acetobacteraceae bacterium]